MFIVVIGYIIAICIFSDTDKVSTIFTTIAALIAAVAFWIQFKRTKNIEEATFIMELNNQFISNDSLTDVEHSLELYYEQVCNGIKEPKLGIDMNTASKERQKMINYLVYMEGLAALVEKGVLQLGVIDDLFAYRFFIAVNNRVVQETELIPCKNYYQGCYKLSKKWTEKLKKDGREIPLKEHPLYEQT